VDEWLDRITNFAAELRYDDIPAAVLQAGRERVVDSLGCALGALGMPHGCPPADIGLAVAAAAGSPQLAGRVIGTRETPAAESAAFVNGCLIRYLDFSDTFPGHHPSDALGALLAVAPVADRTGADLLTAMVISYELSARFTKIGRFNRRGWDNGFATGIGAAAGTALLLGLDHEKLRHAVAIIATANVPLRATRSGQLSMWKGAATAYAVRDAVFAAQLAAAGMTGPEAPFTGRHGMMEQITGPLDLLPFGTEGGDYLMPQVKLKYWPLVHNLQPLVFAGIDLRQQLGDREPAEIQIFTCANAKRESGSEPAKWDPRTRETADHSAPYILAHVLRYGTIGHDAFEPSAYLDESLRPLMRRMTVIADDEIEAVYPDTIRLRIAATDTAGDRYEVEVTNPLGHERNPMGRAEIDAKFTRNAAPLLAPDQIAEALGVWWSLDDRPLSPALDLLVDDGIAPTLREQRIRRQAGLAQPSEATS
jgi:2-methylcitrate dehydratase